MLYNANVHMSHNTIIAFEKYLRHKPHNTLMLSIWVAPAQNINYSRDTDLTAADCIHC